MPLVTEFFGRWTILVASPSSNYRRPAPQQRQPPFQTTPRHTVIDVDAETAQDAGPCGSNEYVLRPGTVTAPPWELGAYRLLTRCPDTGGQNERQTGRKAQMSNIAAAKMYDDLRPTFDRSVPVPS